MSKILISGLTNIELNLKIDKFPIEYCPVRYPFWGIKTNVSGVGINISKALKTLGDDVQLMTIIGDDFEGDSVIRTVESFGVASYNILKLLKETPQSVILYDDYGKRQINVDLKNVQETKYPRENFEKALKDCDLAVLCNINFSRDFLTTAKILNKKIATDLHVILDINDSYNADFMKYADILFMSNEGIIGREEQFAREVMNKYGNEIIVVGMGNQGALLGVRDEDSFTKINAVDVRPIVNTIGAGDALFSAFIHFYSKGEKPYDALKKAVVFAGYKIGENGAANGFLEEDILNQMINI